MEKIVCRYAPSPSGSLHIGNIATSLLTWLDCRSLGGRLVFRNEDLDLDRCKPEYAVKMAEDLRFLSLGWDEGWEPGDTKYAQSCRTGLYDDAFAMLSRKGLVYPCYCSREQRLHGECRCRTLTQAQRIEMEVSGRRPAWKVAVPDISTSFTDGHFGLQSDRLEDFIIRRSDGLYAYQLAVSVDDIDMGVTRIVRGRDLLDSTARQIWLISELGGTAQEYCHCPLIVNSDSRKLSKRYGDLSMETLREKYRSEEIIGKIACILGLKSDPSPLSPQELIEGFSWDKIPTEDIFLNASEFF